MEVLSCFVLYGCERWIIKKTECQRIDTFKLRCWRRFLRVPWTARRSNQSIIKEINPKYSLEGLLLKLKLQYFGHLMRRANSLEKTLMLGKIEIKRRRGQQRMRWLDSITDSVDMNLSKLLWWRTRKPGMLQFIGSQRVGHDWATEQQQQQGTTIFHFRHSEGGYAHSRKKPSRGSQTVFSELLGVPRECFGNYLGKWTGCHVPPSSLICFMYLTFI